LDRLGLSDRLGTDLPETLAPRVLQEPWDRKDPLDPRERPVL
jgi:hypothetical protein